MLIDNMMPLRSRHRRRLTQTVCVLYYCWFHYVAIEPCIGVVTRLNLGRRRLYRAIVELLRHSHAGALCQSSLCLRFVYIVDHGVICAHCLRESRLLRVHIHQAVGGHVRILLLIRL